MVAKGGKRCFRSQRSRQRRCSCLCVRKCGAIGRPAGKGDARKEANAEEAEALARGPGHAVKPRSSPPPREAAPLAPSFNKSSELGPKKAADETPKQPQDGEQPASEGAHQ